MLTVAMPLAQELIIVSRADTPPKDAPYPMLVGTAITGQSARPPMTLARAPSIPAMAMTDKRLMPSTTAPDVLLLVDPTLGEYAMLSEAVKVLGKLNENIETMLKKQKKGEKHENT